MYTASLDAHMEDGFGFTALSKPPSKYKFQKLQVLFRILRFVLYVKPNNPERSLKARDGG